MLFLIFILIFGSVGLLCYEGVPLVMNRVQTMHQKKAAVAEKQLDTMFIQVSQNRLIIAYTLSPLILGTAAFLFSHSLPIALAGSVVGFILPALVIKNMEIQRKIKLQAQLVDGVMILSSSLKGGLSLLQAIEVLVEEMPAPISQEFGLILRENKMGVTLDESFKRMNDRMNIEELGFLINSLLVARETGGDLTKVLSRLAVTIRDNTKIKEKIRTLTLQGRMQGIIMSVLPFIFAGWVMTFNRNHFDVMLNTDTGKILLIVAATLQIIGMILIRRFSIIKI